MNAFKRRVLWYFVFPAISTLGAVTGATAQDAAGLRQVASALSRGDYGLAVEQSRLAAERAPRSVAARLLYARALAGDGDIRAAFDQIEKGLTFAPDNPDLLYYAVEFSAALGRQELDQLHEKAPDSSRSHQLLAEIADAQQDSVQAIAEYQKAVDRDPDNYEALVALADTERKTTSCEKAIPHYQAAIAHDPADTDSLFGLGMCEQSTGDTGKAEEAFRQVVARLPGYAAAQYQLGNTLFLAGDAERALPYLQTAVRLDPKVKEGYFLLGRAYKSLGRGSQAEQAMSKFLTLQEAEVKAAEKRASERRQPAPESQP